VSSQLPVSPPVPQQSQSTPVPPATSSAPSSPAPAVSTSQAPESAPIPIIAARYDADYLRNPAPPYPAFARRRHEEGRVLLRVTVSPDGRPGQVRLQTSSGHESLDDAALATVSTWRFIPARRGDTAITSEVVVPITFALR
jgi:protein TonB